MRVRQFGPLFCVCLMAGCASQPLTDKNADITQLIQAAGIDGQLQALQHPLTTDNIAHGKTALPVSVVQAVNDAIAQSIHVPDVRDDVSKRLAAASPADVHAALAFFQSPAGQHVVALESGKPLPSDAAAASQQTLSDLESSLGTSGLLTDLVGQSVNAAIDYAAEGNCKALGNVSYGGFLGSLLKHAMVNAVHDQVHHALSQRYGALSADDAGAYLAFTRSPAGQAYLQARNQAFNSALTNAGQNLAAVVGVAMEQACNK